MADSSMPTEEVELLTDEYKRVKGKVGRFKLKKKRITAEDMGTTGPVTVSDDQFFLASSAVIPGKTADGETEDDSEILNKLDDILKSLKMEEKEEKKKTKADKRDAEAEKRKKREAKLEAKKRKEFNNLIKTVIAPVTSLLEKIMNWIKWTFIGFIFNQALSWFQDPANQNKVKAIGAFLKAFWPAILAAAVLFLTPFGAFIRSTIKLLRWAVPKMLGIIKKHPKLAAAAALIGAGAIIPQLFPGTVNEQERKTAEGAGSNAAKIEALKKQKENLNPLQIIQGVGSEIDEQIKFLETGESASYGAAPGGRVQPGGGGNEMPTIEGMSGGGEVGSNSSTTIEGMSGGGEVGSNSSTIINNYGLYNGGGLIQNTGGQFNNINTLGSEGTFNPLFGFTGGGITLPNVNIPNMSTNISLMSGGGMLNVNDIKFSGGGDVTNNTGVDITGAGADTQLVALQPGEVVMSKGAVNYWGANTLLGMNKAGGGTNVPKMANNIQMAAGGGMIGAPLSGGGSTSLDPTKTAASMPHVFEAAKAARAQARAEGLSPEEVEKRVVEASERAKKAGPPEKPQHVTGLPPSEMTSEGMNPFPVPLELSQSPYSFSSAPMTGSMLSAPMTGSMLSAPMTGSMLSAPMTGSMLSAPMKNYEVSSSIFANSGVDMSSAFTNSMNLNLGTKDMIQPKATAASGSMPSSPFKSERLNKALTGITADSWKKSSPSTTGTSASTSEAEKIESVEPGSKVIPKSDAKTNPLTSELVMGGGEKTTPAEFENKSGIDYSSAIKISSIASGSKALKNSVPQTMSPVTTPSRNYQPKIINLPTKTTSAAPPPTPGVASPDIPKFSPVRQTGKRNTTLIALGINDLIG